MPSNGLGGGHGYVCHPGSGCLPRHYIDIAPGASTLPTSTIAKQRRTSDKASRREDAARKKRLAAAAKAIAEEEKAERAAPSVQRNPVFSPDGGVIRGARLEFDGKVVHRNNPIRTLVKRAGGKEHALFRKAHADACDRLIALVDECESISAGVSLYEQRSSSLAQTGIISDGTLRAVNNQIQARRDIEALKTYLGESWNILYAICILGVPISVWAKERSNMRQESASGYLLAVLDRLISFWAPKDEKTRIRTIEFN